MKTLLSIEGGAGKNIAATGAVRVAHEREQQVDVITAWPSIWEGNPHVNKVWDWHHTEYFFDKMKDYDEVILHDPYRHTHFLLGNLDLTATWNLMLNGQAEKVKPEIYLNKAEKLAVDQALASVEKPILAIQTNGGTNEGYAWTRDIPLEEVVEVLNQFANDYEIVHLRAGGQLSIEGTKHTAELNLRQSIEVLRRSKKRLLIDSVMQHAAAAFDLPSTVLWVMTRPEQFGYDLHDNVYSNDPELKNTDRLEMLLKGLDLDATKCPFSQGQSIFDTKKVVSSLKQ